MKREYNNHEFLEMFPDERSAREYLEKEMWNGKPVCPHCESERITTLKKDGVYRCKECRMDFTVRGGTIMHKSRLPLTKWILAMCLIYTEKNGITSVKLSKELGITQKTAWLLLKKIRKDYGDTVGRKPKIIKLKIAPLTENWPYWTNDKNIPDIVMAVDNIVGKNISENIRADICQDILCDILSGKIFLKDVPSLIKKYFSNQYCLTNSKFNTVSLDANIPGYDKKKYSEIIASDDVLLT